MHIEKHQLEQAMQIRYISLRFTIQFHGDAHLPMNKTSAIRGGIGEMLLCANCVRDRNCEACDFAQECMVRRTLYSQFEKKPAFVTTGESVGYVLECENLEEFFEAGSTLEFQLFLFGKTIVYFSQFLQAISQLGVVGLGKGHARFSLVSIRNARGKEILDGHSIYMKHYRIQTVGDYVRYRLAKTSFWENVICFRSPVTLKYQGEFQKTLTLEAVIPSVFRRLYILGCFEGLDCLELRWEEDYPKVLATDSRPVQVPRYSGTHNQRMVLHGVKGTMQLSEISEELRAVLLAGEVMHIGKNTSFGFGKYRLK